MRLRKSLFVLALSLLCSARCFAQEITVDAVKPGGVYKVGEKIAWRVEVKGEGAGNVSKVSYLLKKGHLVEMGRGELTIVDGAATLETRLDEPGTILAEFKIPGSGENAPFVRAGAVVDPAKIQPAVGPPKDFAKFWTAKVNELNSVPINPVLEEVDTGEKGIDYWKVTLDNIRGTKIHGQLMRLKGKEKRPALLVFQWAGVHSLNKYWILEYAQKGWLTLNISAHDLPIDAPDDFYQKLDETTLSQYSNIGNDDRDKNYFLRMYLSCYRAADYLMTRPDWDGRTLVALGTSQGGMQAIMLGGLHPKITGVIANVPGGADLMGPMVGHKAGWPRWYDEAQKQNKKTKKKIIATSGYYDVVNFARYIKCPALITVGLIDTSCPAPGVISAFNQIRAPKELAVMEKATHGGPHTEYALRSDAWMKEMAAGRPAPVPEAPIPQ